MSYRVRRQVLDLSSYVNVTECMQCGSGCSGRNAGHVVPHAEFAASPLKGRLSQHVGTPVGFTLTLASWYSCRLVP
jgi:hypothetical protein